MPCARKNCTRTKLYNSKYCSTHKSDAAHFHWLRGRAKMKNKWEAEQRQPGLPFEEMRMPFEDDKKDDSKA